MQIKQGCNKQRVRGHCQDLIAFRRGKMLGDEVIAQLPSGEIKDRTVRRLGRWCHPRKPERVQSIARDISIELFGRVVSRAD